MFITVTNDLDLQTLLFFVIDISDLNKSNYMFLLMPRMHFVINNVLMTLASMAQWIEASL